jgi:hypothetical protein
VQSQIALTPLSFPITYMTRILCTCGCGLQVTYATKRNHLNGHGKMNLRARVLAENQLFERNTRQRQPTSSQDRQKDGTKKRSHSTSEQDGLAKRRKTAQPEIDEVPEIFEFQADTDPMEFSSACRSSKIAERTKQVIERRWGNSFLQNQGPSGYTGSDSSEDEEDTTISEAANDGEDDIEDDSEDDNEDNLYVVPGFSAWDLLGEDFEREAACTGSFPVLAYGSSTH